MCGEEARAIAREINQFNDDPAPGMECVQVLVEICNISADHDSKFVFAGLFSSIGGQDEE